MRTWALVAAIVSVGTGAAAQSVGPIRVTREIETPAAEATAAVMMASFQKDRGQQREFPDGGWSLSAGANLGPWVAIVGEADGYANYYTAPASRPGYGAQEAVNHVHDFLAGPRIQSRFVRVGSGRDGRDVRIFGQVLAGLRVGEVFAGGRAVQPGAGVDVYTPRGLTIRFEADHCFVNGSGRGLSGGRMLIGIVLGPS